MYRGRNSGARSGGDPHGQPTKCSFDLRSRFACNGSIVVFVERLEKPNPFLDALTGVLEERTPINVATNYRSATRGRGPG